MFLSVVKIKGFLPFCNECFSSLIEAPHHSLGYPLHRQMGRVPEGGWGGAQIQDVLGLFRLLPKFLMTDLG
jgi:hypothetical protein